eukprot:TRINITY_DN22867_c0_g1_i1.p1 TRINITY_DN22867_c0_g1~~TRINITY_DN22867_c0_g1_i1.p1  ORF type:complete len:112 (+),score=6.09 TRINITY_DN22867_c0_g1_i1:117-452(+)
MYKKDGILLDLLADLPDVNWERTVRISPRRRARVEWTGARTYNNVPPAEEVPVLPWNEALKCLSAAARVSADVINTKMALERPVCQHNVGPEPTTTCRQLKRSRCFHGTKL